MIDLKNKKIRALILIMSALIISGITFSHFYYKNVNESVDPRIRGARKLYEKYDEYAQLNAFDSVFALLDTIETIYSTTSHYHHSWEKGVLYNNRCAVYLTMALSQDIVTSNNKNTDSLLLLAKNNINKSIQIYEDWLEKFENKTSDEIKGLIYEEFYAGLEEYDQKDKFKYLKNRVKEITDSQEETKRRLSVSYTNKGLIHRHNMEYKDAALCYKKAIELWDRNLTAENNLNLLLDRPLEKRNFLQRMFPPKR